MAGTWLVLWSAIMGEAARKRGYPRLVGWLLAPWLGVFAPLAFLGGGREDYNEGEVD